MKTVTIDGDKNTLELRTTDNEWIHVESIDLNGLSLDDVQRISNEFLGATE